jgi:hypothetical protein
LGFNLFGSCYNLYLNYRKSKLLFMKKKNIPFSGIIIAIVYLTSCSKGTVNQAPKTSVLNTSSNHALASLTGIGTSPNIYNLNDTRDLVTPIDFYSTGHASQLICYRPGASAFWIMQNNGIKTNLQFTATIHSSSGIGTGSSNYTLNDNRDKVFAYDLNGTGKLDHIVAYRPGTGAFWIFEILNPGTSATFQYVLKSSNGVGGYDLSDSRDIIVPFDFYSTGKSTQLICYRPGTGACWILNNTAAVGQTPTFTPVYQTSNGISGSPTQRYDLSDNRDLILPFD